MVRVIVLVGVIVAIVFSGGALADVSVVTTVAVRRADGRVVTARVTRATQIMCDQRPCDQGSLRSGAVVEKAEVARLANGVRFFRRLELAT